jgi:hypothetical protein
MKISARRSEREREKQFCKLIVKIKFVVERSIKTFAIGPSGGEGIIIIISFCNVEKCLKSRKRRFS